MINYFLFFEKINNKIDQKQLKSQIQTILIAGSMRFCGAPKITLIPVMTTGFPKPICLVLFSLLSLTVVLSIALSTIVGKMKQTRSVWENLW
jgi:hypothetical protein